MGGGTDPLGKNRFGMSSALTQRGAAFQRPLYYSKDIRTTVAPEPADIRGGNFASKQNGKVSKDVGRMTFEFITVKILKLPGKCAVSESDRRG